MPFRATAAPRSVSRAHASCTAVLAFAIALAGACDDPLPGTPDAGTSSVEFGPDIDLASFVPTTCVDGHVDVLPAFAELGAHDGLRVVGYRTCVGQGPVQFGDVGALCADGTDGTACTNALSAQVGLALPACGLAVVAEAGGVVTARYGGELVAHLGAIDTPLEAYAVAAAGTLVDCAYGAPSSRSGPDGSFEWVVYRQLTTSPPCVLVRDVVRVRPDGTSEVVSRRDMQYPGCP